MFSGFNSIYTYSHRQIIECKNEITAKSRANMQSFRREFRTMYSERLWWQVRAVDQKCASEFPPIDRKEREMNQICLKIAENGISPTNTKIDFSFNHLRIWKTCLHLKNSRRRICKNKIAFNRMQSYRRRCVHRVTVCIYYIRIFAI